jgi:hypothetical protein
LVSELLSEGFERRNPMDNPNEKKLAKDLEIGTEKSELSEKELDKLSGGIIFVGGIEKIGSASTGAGGGKALE